jgi:RNA polymerase-binding protein DksA
MAMELNDPQRAAIRTRLLQRRNELQSEVRDAGEALRDQDRGVDVRDSKDDADIRQRVAGEDLQLARDLEELQQVGDALQRLDEGTYGDCADCGSPITAPRLAAQPAACLCLSCQARSEARR